MEKIKLSVVIPAYNEAGNIKKGVLSEVYGYLSKKKYPWEVLIVDDASSDGTVKLVERFVKDKKNFKLLREPHRGKGGTVIAGVLSACGEYVLFADMDQATPLTEVEKFFPKFREGYEVVIGSRSGREGAPFTRKAMAYGFQVLRTLILRLPYKDTQCGFKAFRKDAAREIFERMRVFKEGSVSRGASVTAGFDLEVLYIARKLKLRVAEVPVVWHHRESKRVNPVKDSLEGLRDLLRVRINALMGRYKI